MLLLFNKNIEHEYKKETPATANIPLEENNKHSDNVTVCIINDIRAFFTGICTLPIPCKTPLYNVDIDEKAIEQLSILSNIIVSFNNSSPGNKTCKMGFARIKIPMDEGRIINNAISREVFIFCFSSSILIIAYSFEI